MEKTVVRPRKQPSEENIETPRISIPRQRRSIRSLIEPAEVVAKKSDRIFSNRLAEFETSGEFYRLPRYTFIGPRGGGDYLRIGIFAGIHGDEIGSAMGAVRLLELFHGNPKLARGYELFIYPVCNPTGYEDNTRWSRSGIDLNRFFWKNSRFAEVNQLEQELIGLNFDGLISLHADDTSDGLYGFASGPSLSRYVLQPALHAASSVLPLNESKEIDSFPARKGIIVDGYDGMLTAPPKQHPRPFEVVFETPHNSPVEDQIQAILLAVSAILEQYQVLISQADNI